MYEPPDFKNIISLFNQYQIHYATLFADQETKEVRQIFECGPARDTTGILQLVASLLPDNRLAPATNCAYSQYTVRTSVINTKQFEDTSAGWLYIQF